MTSALNRHAVTPSRLRSEAAKLRNTVQVKNLVGDAKGMLLRRANLLETQANALETTGEAA